MDTVRAIFFSALLSTAIAASTFAEEAAAPRPARQFSEKQLAQQQRMTDCNAEATANRLKGSDRRAFMQSCLSGGSVTATVGSETASAPDEARIAQKEKKRSCTVDAQAQPLKGDARQQFMRECLAQ